MAPDATAALLDEARTATVFMFGQTGSCNQQSMSTLSECLEYTNARITFIAGSGKTYTMSGIYQRASEQLFSYLKVHMHT